MSALATIILVTVAVAGISIAIFMLDDVFAGTGPSPSRGRVPRRAQPRPPAAFLTGQPGRLEGLLRRAGDPVAGRHHTSVTKKGASG